MRTISLDLDGSLDLRAGDVIDARAWRDRLRFACSMRQLEAFSRWLDTRLPTGHGTVFYGSGDFHHLSLPLIERAAAGRDGMDVVVFDNHPDNMRFPFGVHCGSWVRRLAAIPQIAQVHVVGITSNDISWRHAWENHLLPLYRGRVSYWSTGVAVRWAHALGLGHAVRSFDSVPAMLAAFARHMASRCAPVYVSIDKDVLSADDATTNWDQGQMRLAELETILNDLQARVIGSDVTGDVSIADYPQAWKRWLSGLDGQQPPDARMLQQWQGEQQAINLRLAGCLAGRSHAPA